MDWRIQTYFIGGELKDFGLVESDSSDYNLRTLKNIIDSDGTLILGDTRSPGTALTVKLCMMQDKPFISNPNPEVLIEFYKENNIKVLNVAGNRSSKLNDKEIDYYKELLKERREKRKKKGRRKKKINQK